MFPVLVEIGPVTLYTYGLLVGLGFLSGVLWTAREAGKAGLKTEAVLDLCFYLVVAALVGSRLLFVFLSWSYYQYHLADIFKIWQGGLVFYGGLLLAALAALIYIPLKKLPLWLTADTLAPGAALGQGIGRLGCLAAGCCYGQPTDLPWAITFTNPRSLAPLNQPLHPTQAYSALAMFALFAFLVYLRRRRVFAGQVFWTYALLHGLIRTGLEYLRDDYRGPGLGAFVSSTQVVALGVVAVAVIMWACLFWTRTRPAERGLEKTR